MKLEDMAEDKSGEVSDKETACGEKTEIRDCLNDSVAMLGVSQTSVLACNSNIAHDLSELTLVRDEKTALKLGEAEVSLLMKDHGKEWNCPGCNTPRIQSIKQNNKWKGTRQLFSIASQKCSDVLFLTLRASEGLMGGGGCFGSKSPKVEIKIEEKSKMLVEAISAIEKGIQESDNKHIDKGLQIITNLIEESRFYNYPPTSVRRFIDILYHPILQNTEMGFVRSSVADYFVALHFKQVLESEDLGYFNEVNICNNHNVLNFIKDFVTSGDCLLYTSDAADE